MCFGVSYLLSSSFVLLDFGVVLLLVLHLPFLLLHHFLSSFSSFSAYSSSSSSISRFSNSVS